MGKKNKAPSYGEALGLPPGPASDALDDLVACWKKHDDRLTALLSKTPFLGLVPKEKTQSTGFKPKKKGRK